MESEARYTWVGAAVLLLLAALVAAVVWLRNVGDEANFNRYAIHFSQQALDGLEVGADVTLRGIRVGRVEDYALPGEGKSSVRVQVRIDRRASMRTNTVAVVTRNLVTGIAAITLFTGSPPGEALVKVPEGETLPVIGEGRSDLDEIAGRVSKVGEAATIALGNLNQLLAPENRATLMTTVREFGDLANGINQRLAALEGSLTRMGSAATEIGKAATAASVALDNIGGAATSVGSAATSLAQSGDSVAATATQSAKRLDATLGAADAAIADAQRAFARIAQASDALQQQVATTAGRLELTAASLDDQMAATITELRLSVAAGGRVMDRLREPRAALLGPGPAQLGPGEKKP